MKLSKYHIILLIAILASSGIKAQDYKHSAQLSFGHYWGFAYKHMFNQENGAMARLQYGENSILITGLRVFHKPAFPDKSSQWFINYGFGLHMAYRTKIESRNLFRPFAPAIIHEGHFVSPGIDGLIGMEYRFLKYPFTLSGDFNPNFEFFGPGYFRLNMANISFTAAYVF